MINLNCNWQRVFTIYVDINTFRILKFGVRVLHDGDVLAGVKARVGVEGVRNVQCYTLGHVRIGFAFLNLGNSLKQKNCLKSR